MKRLLRKLFHRHAWFKFELFDIDDRRCEGQGQCKCEKRVWYVGYSCAKCGELGYEVPA